MSDLPVEYRMINMRCQNCGQPLEAGWDHNTGASMVIEGARPIKVRHLGGKFDCPPEVRKATVYSIWDANRALEAVEESRNRKSKTRT